MSSPTSTALPASYHAPLAEVNANNHGGWVVICTAFGLLVILITLLIRLYIRTKVSPPIGLDDATIAASSGLAILQAGLVFAQINNGYGKSMKLLDQAHLVKVQQLAYVAQLFYIIVLYTSKCSVVLLFKRISIDRTHALVSWTILSACAVSGFISLLLVALRCDLAHPWLQYGVECSTLESQWAAVAALDIATEIALFGMSFHLVWNLQTSVSRKARVVFAFSLRLPVIMIAALRLYYIDKEIDSSNPTLVGAIATLLTELEISYGIMSATIPCLRPFLASFVTNFGAMGPDTVISGSQVGTSGRDKMKSTNGSFAMASMSASGNVLKSANREKSAVRNTNREVNEDMFRPDRANNVTSVTHNNSQAHDASSIGSNDSTKMIIKKEVQWQVEGSSRAPSQNGMRG